jgi:hypothetical protein
MQLLYIQANRTCDVAIKAEGGYREQTGIESEQAGRVY